MEQRSCFVPVPVVEDSASLRFLYRTVPGRVILKLATLRGISMAAGAFMDSRLSKCLIPTFIRKVGIDLSEYAEEDYTCFNDCFARHIRPELRPVDDDPAHLIAPCDGLLSVYPVEDGLVIPVKQSRYSLADLLRDEELAKQFDGGLCLVFRLCVNHYHRYAYADSGVKGSNIFLNGRLHTVRPIALREVPVFTENCREYTVIETENFGKLVQMEVGAMLVGKICNNDGGGAVIRGQEKGHFAYGGSTVILLLGKDRVEPAKELLQATADNCEVPVKLGMALGSAVKS